MKIKIGLIFLLVSTFLCIFIVSNKIQFRNNTIKVPKQVTVKKYKKITVSEILNTVGKYNELKVEEVKCDNKDAYVCISINGNIQSVNNMMNNLRKEKNLLAIKEINISKVSQNEEAEMKLFFKHYQEVN